VDALFYMAPAVIAAGALVLAWVVVRHLLRLRRALQSGLVAQGRCLAAYAETYRHSNGPVRTTMRHVYEFTTREGHTVRFQERHGPATTVAGDLVTVHYAPDRPRLAAVQPPRPGLTLGLTIGLLIFLGFVVLVCVGFVVLYATVFAPLD
jgi:hypothetical protein